MRRLAAYFEEHKNELKVPDKRKVRYALVDMQGIRSRTQISPQDIARSYEDNQQQYATPEQVRASHILLKTEGKDEAVVKKQAEELLAKVKAGADFADLAKKNSQDETSAVKGGDLDFFGKGRMVPEFDKAAFTLAPGQISDLVKTQYGFHIIKVTEKKAATTKTLEEVRAQIEDQLKWDRAQAEAQRISDDVAGKLKLAADFDTVAKPRGLTVGESALFSREEPITGLGMAPAAVERAFELKDGEISEAIRTPQGFAFLMVTGRQDAYVPKLEEVKVRVKRRGAEEEGGGSRPPARRDGRRADEVRGFRRRRQGSRRGGQDDRFHRAGRPDSRRRHEPRRGRGGVRACGRRRQRPDRHRQRGGDCEGARAEGADRGGARDRQGGAEDRVAERTAQPVLRRLHDQGARPDESDHQPGAHRAAGDVERDHVSDRLRPALAGPSHLTNTFGMIASGSPRRNRRSGAVSVSSARRSRLPTSAPSPPVRSELPNGFFTIS